MLSRSGYAYPKTSNIKAERRNGETAYIEPSIWDLRRERGVYCEWCSHLYVMGLQDWRNEAMERHHMLVHDLARFHAELTVRENLMGACDYHHRGVCVLDSYEMRQWFWSVQCERYGKPRMLKYILGLDPKLWQSGRIDRAFLDGEGVRIAERLMSEPV